MSGHVEHEVKLDADPDLVLPDLSGVAPDVQARPRPTLALDATYFDAADGRLLAAGVTVRRRSGEGTRWTVKRPSSAVDPAAGVAVGAVADAVVRGEADVFDHSLSPPDPVVELVSPWLAAADLVPVACLRSERRRMVFEVGSGDADPLVELDDDLVAVHRMSGGSAEAEPAARFREVELEVVASAGPAFERAALVAEAVAERLVALGCRPSPAGSKLARALDLLGPLEEG